ncbi:MAG: ABC transporter permease [Bacteroidetes bacterium]|nr:ABC transporter permease [Bacteroidota bacterium]
MYLINNINKGLRKTAEYYSEEMRLIMADAGAVLLFIVAMVIYPVVYSIGYSGEVIKDLPVAVVDLNHSSLSRQYSRMLDATEQIHVVCKPGSLKEAESLFYEGNIKGIVLIPDDFEKNILQGIQSNVTVYCDASYFLIYKQVYAGAAYSTGTLSAGVEIKKLLAQGRDLNQALDQRDPLKTNIISLYNPSAGYGSFIMPGVLLIILQQTLLIGIGLLGATTREKIKNRNLIVQPLTRGGSITAVLGKSLAYLVIYMFNVIFIMVVIPKWFSFPDKSGFLTTLFLTIPYILSISFLGITISVLFKKRAHALLFMVFLSNIILFFSGLSWPSAALPPLLYKIAHIFPSTLMIPAYLRVRIMGAPLSSVAYEYTFILIQMVVYFVLACLAYKFSSKKLARE